MTTLAVLRAGPVCTIQDAGRTGYLRYGVTPAGPMDWIAHRTANLLAGNPPEGAAVEIGPGGLSVAARDAALRVGISAAGFRVRRNGNDLPARMALTLPPGARLDIEPGHRSLWAYLSLAGGLAEPPVMGSLSMHLRSGLGPCGGTALAAGQMLTAGPSAWAPAPDLAVIDAVAPAPAGPIRLIPGPQDDCFAPDALAVLCGGTYRIGPRSDRMAYRLDGPRLVHARGHDIVSDGVVFGSIQVPGDGQPLVLMADRQPTGGYPKIATVIRADLPRLAQTRPGQAVRFAVASREEAVAALRAAIPDRAALLARCRIVRQFGGAAQDR